MVETIYKDKKILDLGSGIDKISGAIRLDNNKEVKPDILHDLNNYPYPFENDQFDEIHLNNILLHLDDVFSTMKEIHRIVKVDGKVIVKCAYFRSNYAYHFPGNKNHFTVNTFNFFDPEHLFFKKFKYTKTKFDVEKIIFNENFNSGLLKKLLTVFANKFPQIYESKLSHLFPLDEIKYQLKKIV
jgi:SAM-dependent methyltransferase